MSIMRCTICDTTIDTDYDVEHIDECKIKLAESIGMITDEGDDGEIEYLGTEKQWQEFTKLTKNI